MGKRIWKDVVLFYTIGLSEIVYLFSDICIPYVDFLLFLRHGPF